MGKGHHRKGNIAVILLAGVVLPLLLSLLPGCGREDSPQKEIEKFVAAGKEAAEARKAGDLRELISAGYADGHGRTRRDVAALAARYLYANKNIHLFTRIDELVFSGPDAARLRLYVAMAGQNVSDLDALLNMRADLYRFDCELAREGDGWKVVRADWQPAGLDDFL